MVFFNSSVFRVAAEVACCKDRYVMASFSLVQVVLVLFSFSFYAKTLKQKHKLDIMTYYKLKLNTRFF